MYIDILVKQFCSNASFMKGYSPDTVKRYTANLRLFTGLTGISEVEAVTDEAVRSFFFRGRSERQWSPATFITYLKSLRVFFRWCVKEGYLTTNPAAYIEKPALEKKIPLKLTREEALRLLELIDNYPWSEPFLRRRNHAIFAVFIFAGLRRKELLHLSLADINVDNQTILVRKGKGGKDRYVPVCAPLADSLRRYLVERARLHKTCPEFFASHAQNSGLTDNGFKYLLNLIIKSFGKKFSAHKLRHTFATLMLEGGCDIYSLSTMMGHSDISTTTIYLTATAEHLRGQMSKHPLCREGWARGPSTEL
jgi:site-specific recombinase XerD